VAARGHSKASLGNAPCFWLNVTRQGSEGADLFLFQTMSCQSGPISPILNGPVDLFKILCENANFCQAQIAPAEVNKKTWFSGKTTLDALIVLLAGPFLG
jgi:hypothetical protein